MNYPHYSLSQFLKWCTYATFMCCLWTWGHKSGYELARMRFEDKGSSITQGDVFLVPGRSIRIGPVKVKELFIHCIKSEDDNLESRAAKAHNLAKDGRVGPFTCFVDTSQ